MTFLVVFASALAVASAGYLSPISTIYANSQYLPTIGANGVPIDTLAVQTAKAAHFVAKAEAHARNGDYIQGVVSPISLPLVSSYAANPVYSTYSNTLVAPAILPNTYLGPQHIPTIGSNGVPVDTPAVQSAKAAHFVAKAEASARNGDAQAVLSPIAATYSVTPIVATVDSKYTGPQHIPTIGADGVPVDTPAVQAAKAAHFAAKAEAQARNADSQSVEVVAPTVSTYTSSVVTQKYTGPQHIPTIGIDGVPVDTPAVQSAKAAHFAAKAEAEARSGDNLEGVVIKAAEPVVSTYTSSVSTSTGVQGSYEGPQHIPTIGTGGVPVDTPAVQSAKAAHFAAKAVAKARSGENDESSTVTSISTPVVSKYIYPSAATYISKPVISSYIANPVISTYGALYNGYSNYSPLVATQPITFRSGIW